MKKKRAKSPSKASGAGQSPPSVFGVPAIDNLQDFLRWLVVQEQFENEKQIVERERLAHRWTIFPYQNAIFVGVATGLSGQEILNRFPELDLPVSEADDELTDDLKNLPFKPNVFYYGPFNQENSNLI